MSGTLVLNSKLPQQDFGGSASLEYGQFKHLSGQFDVCDGALTQDKRL
ncbi:hypothetical protein ACRAWD_22435 [Caulobacter segnis]